MTNQPPQPQQPPSAAKPAPLKLLLTPREAAKALGISERTLWTLSNTDDKEKPPKPPAIRTVRIGKLVRYSPAELQRFIDEQQAAG